MGKEHLDLGKSLQTCQSSYSMYALYLVLNKTVDVLVTALTNMFINQVFPPNILQVNIWYLRFRQGTGIQIPMGLQSLGEVLYS